MILSVSRRTDIPNYYPEWFMKRIEEGYLYVRNPMNLHQVSHISLTPEVVDCIVFWTKNPEPMLSYLPELDRMGYHYFFQFTLTGYGRDIEPGIPHKKEKMLDVFRELSKHIGSDKVVWRYDPILFNGKYTPEYHVNAFQTIAETLCGYTHRCIISFVDEYAKNRKNMRELDCFELPEPELKSFAKQLADMAKKNGMSIAACAEKVDLEECGIGHSSCVDKVLIEEIIGCKLDIKKDKNQRPECGCVESVEVGTYNTCRNGCKYCYANHSMESMLENCKKYDVNSQILCGKISEEDIITERKVKSLRMVENGQQVLF